ncbi:MAG: transketolase [Clostridia bacterium]|nr:transketolase [Clostridia bacterium]
MNNETRALLTEKAKEIRRGIIEGTHSAGCGHPGGSLSVTDILAYLYFKEMHIDPAHPDDENRDRFVLSKGHAAPALYAALAARGYFPPEDLKTLRKTDSYLQGHPDMKRTPGVDMSTGSLGLGISAACGIALAGKLSGRDYRVYCALGDGESEEGQVWEAAMFAAHYGLDNLTVFLDFNGLQIDGKITDIVDPTPLDQKFLAFGWNVVVIDGHSFDEIERALGVAKATKGRPTLILANTVKGKGVSFMENQVGWHGKAPSDEQYEIAMSDLA